jgi:starch phosphorylase
MPIICFLASHRVNGVSFEHTNILRQIVFRDFNDMYPHKIISITNGVSQRRWVQCANPRLAEMITNSLGNEEWLINLNLLSELNAWKYDREFIQAFLATRFHNKKRLLDFLFAKHSTLKDSLADFALLYLLSKGSQDDLLIDIFAKRFSPSKRQPLYLFYLLLRYLRLKEGACLKGHAHPAIGKVLYLVAGRAPHSSFEGKKMIEAVYRVAKLINNDP